MILKAITSFSDFFTHIYIKPFLSTFKDKEIIEFYLFRFTKIK